jgi:antiviral helicase SLH1
MVLSQHPIESQFVAGMIDSMNAEIALGTITNVSEAVQWMGYTYLFVRMKKNPFNVSYHLSSLACPLKDHMC